MIKKFFIILVFFTFFSCEEVIEVDIPDVETRLVVNGIVKVDITQEFVPVEIMMSESSGFFDDNQIISVDRAVIIYGTADPEQPDVLTNSATSVLEETEPGSGTYIPSYIPGTDTDDRIVTSGLTEDAIFILVIDYQDKRYAAQTGYRSAVPINNLGQGDETLFDEDDIELKLSITDTEDSNEFYVLDFGEGEFLAITDEFFNGQEFEFSYFLDRTVQVGETINVSLTGADQEYYNYIDLLVEQTQDGGGVFQTPVATVRGNVFDITGLDNINVVDNLSRPNDFALGYFAVIQEYRDSVVIE